MAEQRKSAGNPVSREALVRRFVSNDGWFTAIDCALTSGTQMSIPMQDADPHLEPALLSGAIASTLRSAGMKWLSPLDGVLLINAGKADDMTLIRVRDVQSGLEAQAVSPDLLDGVEHADGALRPQGAKVKVAGTKPGMSLDEFAARIETAAEVSAGWQGDELYIVPVFCRVLSPMTSLVKDLPCEVWRQARISLVPERTEPDWLAVTQVLLMIGTRYPATAGIAANVVADEKLGEACRIDGKINPATARARAMLKKASRGTLDTWFKQA